MNGKKIFALFFIAAMVAGMLPAVMVNAAMNDPFVLYEDTETLATDVQYGDLIRVKGNFTDVPAGTLVYVYWDNTDKATWDTATMSGRMNSTRADSDGNYEIWLEVPESKIGTHTIWIESVKNDEVLGPFDVNVIPLVKVNPSSGVATDKITITVHGFKASKDLVAFIFTADDFVWNGTDDTYTDLAFGDGVETEFTWTLDNKPIEPGNLTINCAVEDWVDNGDGTLTGSAGGEGTINYVTGKFTLEFNAAPAGGDNLSVLYRYYPAGADPTVEHVKLVAFVADKFGKASATFTVDGDWNDDDYIVTVYDAIADYGVDDFAKGPTISLSPVEGATGKIVRIHGRGWEDTANNITDIELDGTACIMYNPTSIDDIVISSSGTWSADVLIPYVDDEDDYEITVTDFLGIDASADFEVTAISKAAVTPGYGPQGGSITVSGTYYSNKKGVDLTIELDGTEIGTTETKADGTWSKTCQIPAISSGTVDLVAYDDNGFTDTIDFRVGNMVAILNPKNGWAGAEISYSAMGFTEDGKYSLEFGSELLVEEGDVDADGEVVDSFFVPQLAAGVYKVIITDIESEIEVETTFEITRATSVELSPSNAPNEYKVNVTGWGFYPGATVEFILYNKTSTGAVDTWRSIEVLDDETDAAAEVLDSGKIMAYWFVDDSDIWSNGNYYMNITDSEGYALTVPFVIGDAHVVIAPRKATFAPGETLSFTIEHSLGSNAATVFDNTYLKIYDPNGLVVFQTDNAAFDWKKVSTYYVVTYASQVASGNPMILSEDAPAGTWKYKWYDDDDDLIKEGTFTVSASSGTVSPEIAGLQTDIANLKATVSGIEASVNAKVDAVKADVAAVKVDIAGVKTAVDTQVAALKTDITGVKSDVAALKTSVSADVAAVKTAVQADVAAVKTDVGALKTSVAAVTTAVTETSNAVKSLATSVATINTAVTGAKTAADNANAAVGGLQTLVYGAIGASLIAAAAAIVALMQISRKIA